VKLPVFDLAQSAFRPGTRTKRKVSVSFQKGDKVWVRSGTAGSKKEIGTIVQAAGDEGNAEWSPLVGEKDQVCLVQWVTSGGLSKVSWIRESDLEKGPANPDSDPGVL